MKSRFSSRRSGRPGLDLRPSSATMVQCPPVDRAPGGRWALLGLFVVGLSACATPAQPRTSHPVPFEQFVEIGAVIDASRAFPVAFYADPAAKPRIVDVEGQDLHASDWLTHLAKRMNQALAKVSLYDARFMPIAQTIFREELHAGRYTYPYEHAAQDLQKTRVPARIAALRFVSANRVRVAADSGVKVVVELRLADLTRLYSFESTGSNWDLDCFTGIARKILGDVRFWEAVKSGL